MNVGVSMMSVLALLSKVEVLGAGRTRGEDAAKGGCGDCNEQRGDVAVQETLLLPSSLSCVEPSLVLTLLSPRSWTNLQSSLPRSLGSPQCGRCCCGRCCRCHRCHHALSCLRCCYWGRCGYCWGHALVASFLGQRRFFFKIEMSGYSLFGGYSAWLRWLQMSSAVRRQLMEVEAA